MPILILAILAFMRALWVSFKDPKFRGLLIFISGLILFGGIFYHNVEGWTYLNSFYFCISTLGTVGFGDVVPVTTPGKIFTMIYIIVGIGAFLVFINTLTTNVAERRKRMKREKGLPEEADKD